MMSLDDFWWVFVAWAIIALMILVVAITWRGGAIDKDKARGSLSAWWRRLRGRD